MAVYILTPFWITPQIFYSLLTSLKGFRSQQIDYWWRIILRPRQLQISKAECKKLSVVLSCSTYPNEVIVSFETNAYRIFTPSHGLWNIWSTKIPLTDKKKTLRCLNVSKDLNHTAVSHISNIFLFYLQFVKLSVLPVIKLEFLFHCNTHSQLFIS